jgi:NhaA family Na+:H+ antiporter
LCGIGFTRSQFIGFLAFAGNPLLQEEVKIGILIGSALAAILETLVLLAASRRAL